MELVCKRNLGAILRVGDRYVIDQLAEFSNIKIPVRGLVNYLKQTYNITLQQYYNLVIYNTIKSPRCTCGKPLKYKGKLSGYIETCGDINCIVSKRTESLLDTINSRNK